ncbi:MAG: hypothetical protein ACKVUT_17655 [Gaiella sp.]
MRERRQRRTRVVLLLGLATAVVSSALALGLERSEARPALAPPAIDCGTSPGAAFNVGGASGSTWYVLVSVGTTCETGRQLVAGLTRRVVSSGTTDQVAFRLGDWSCAVTRSGVLGGCSARIKGTARYVVVLGVSTTNEIIRGQLLGNTIRLDTIAPFPADPAPPPPPAPGGSYRGATPVRCTSVPGKPWQTPLPDRVAGNRWAVYAVGGLSCLAAQGWVADVTPRLPGRREGAGGDFFGDSGWHCWTSGAGLLLATCARGTNPRGPLDPRGVVIVPDGFQRVLQGKNFSGSVELALSVIYDRRRPDQSELVDPRSCGPQNIPGARWTLSKQSGTRWLVGVRGGYPCSLVQAPMLTQLGEWAVAPAGSTRRSGVAGAWRCLTSSLGSASGGTRLICLHDGLGPQHRIVLIPQPAGVDTLMRALR